MLKLIVLPCLFAIVILSCKDDDPKSPLEGCCGNDAIEETVGNGYVYVPNIFTPNGDGINDYLFVNVDSIASIAEFEIKDKSGKVVFEVFDAMPNDPSLGWDGEVDDLLVEGLYSVSVTVVAEDGTSRTIKGKVCNFPCDDTTVTERVPGENCQFPAQVTDGHFCPTCPSGEPGDCFE
jgi:gliding motility-associated-like protein